MVGFPSETDKDFKKSLNLLNNVMFDEIDVYKYDERPNLPSCRLEKKVPELIKTKRYYQIKYYALSCKIKKRLMNVRFLNARHNRK